MRQRIFVLTLLACAFIPLQAEVPSLVAIQDARIVTVSGAVIEKGTVVLKDGIIADVGPNAAVPAGAWVVDGKGLTVYPGLIDAFSTWGLPEAPAAAPAAGGRGTQAAAAPGQAAPPRSRGPEDRPGTNSWVMAADLVKNTERRVDLAHSAGFTTAVTFPRQGLVGGHGAIVNLGGETPGAMIVEPDAGLYMSTTPSGYLGYPNSLMGVLAYFRQLWIDANYYKMAKEMYAKSRQTIPRPAYDRALEGVLSSRRLLLPAAGPVQMERMVKLGKELQTPVVLWGVTEGYRMADELKKSGTPVVLNVKWPTRERDRDPDLIDTMKVLEHRDKAPTAPAVLAKAGVKFAVSSDGMESPKDVLKALKKSIDLGLSKEAAIRALTLSAAEIYGVDQRMGSIDKGKMANLVVVKGDLFDERLTIAMIFVDGVKYLPPPDPPQTPGGNGPGNRPSTVDQEEN
ncbi:amidohydrolase family protein [Paludibaculum fermentans]|uniref:Amidohydrolase family protein n=1 Tax=Paludibaculum fermentans TaxID=1473598 RepID=A0A7S7NLI2_PALFE|nr:amidohydrolase family protein [Paludibaculum fermentans]QOY85755.1 amidohydrolase family protein [Paludibaculum fermentans]